MMRGLRRLQLAFAGALFSPAGANVDQRIRTHGMDPARRVQVYRNNMIVGLTGALEAV